MYQSLEIVSKVLKTLMFGNTHVLHIFGNASKVSHSVLIYLIIYVYDLTPGWKADFISLHRPIDTLTIE